MNNQYMPKYVKVKQIKRPDGTVCYLEKDHINAVEDTLLYEDTQIGSMMEKTGTDLVTIIRHVADGSSSTECKIASISANGSKLPIDSQKNVDITIPKNVEDGAQVNKIESINLNGTDLTIDPETKKASGLVKSTLPIPNEISFTQMTSLNFCNMICDLDTCKVGVIYCGYSRITDAPCNGCEITVSVMKDESTASMPRAKVLILKMNSTNNREKNWITMYHNEEMKYGTTQCPWEAELLTPVSTSNDTDDWIGASRKYVNDHNVQAATQDEIQTGTVTNKYISPALNKNATKIAVIKNSEDMSLDSANQKKVQNWLGTNQLTFTFNDNTTKTFNFVCNEVV